MPALTISANVNNLATINGNPVAYDDIYLDNNNNISMSTDLQAVLEECAQAAQTLLGECVLDTSIGIPYEQVVWVGVPNVPQFTAALRAAFLNVAGVTDVISIIVGQTGDVLTYTAIIQTIYGTGTIQ
jgi:hypothetical protein